MEKVRGTSNLQLIFFAKKLGLKHFRGVYSLDRLPNKKRSRECFISNLARSDSQGTHWIAVWVRGRELVYLDSFGGPVPPEILAYLKTPSQLSRGVRCVQRSTEQLQSFSSDLCGFYCLYFLDQLQRRPAWQFDEILETLRDQRNVRTMQNARIERFRDRLLSAD